jgi:hypothetical protein
MSASSPRLSSSLQGFLPIVYLIDLFNGVATWKESKQKQPMKVKKKILGTKVYCLVLKK